MTESKSKGLWLMLGSGVFFVVMGLLYFVMMPQQANNVEKQSPDLPVALVAKAPDNSIIRIVQSSDSEAGVPEVPMDQKVAAGVKWFQASTLGRSKYSEKVKTLSAVNDEVSARLLMALVDDPKSSIAAIEALGDVRNPEMKPEILEKLRKQIKSRRLDIQQSALESLARIGGDEVLPELETYLVRNWRRPDGWGEQVSSAIIRGVADVGTADSLRMLGRQLDRVAERDWLPDYGTVVVEAISRYNHPLIREALLRYIDGMTLRLQSVPNRVGQNYMKEKIKQATDAVAKLETKPLVGAPRSQHFGHNHD